MRCTPTTYTLAKCMPMRYLPMNYMPLRRILSEIYAHEIYARKMHVREMHTVRCIPVRCMPMRCTLMRCMCVRCTPTRYVRIPRGATTIKRSAATINGECDDCPRRVRRITTPVVIDFPILRSNSFVSAGWCSISQSLIIVLCCDPNFVNTVPHTVLEALMSLMK
jgi:hypothetical protein